MAINRPLPASGRGLPAKSRAFAILVSILLVMPQLSAAQCTATGDSGHAHGNSHTRTPTRTGASSLELKRDIDSLLTDERGRVLLAEALLEDADFMHGFVARLMAEPQWKTLATDLLAESPSVSGSVDVAAPDHGPVSYTCPMHPGVVSGVPGVCTICGMELDRGEITSNK